MKTFAAIIIFLGSVFLLKNLGIIRMDLDFWGVFWPVVFILIGLKMFFSSRSERKYAAWGWRNSQRADDKGQNCGCEGSDCNCKNGDNHDNQQS